MLGNFVARQGKAKIYPKKPQCHDTLHEDGSGCADSVRETSMLFDGMFLYSESNSSPSLWFEVLITNLHRACMLGRRTGRLSGFSSSSTNDQGGQRFLGGEKEALRYKLRPVKPSTGSPTSRCEFES